MHEIHFIALNPNISMKKNTVTNGRLVQYGNLLQPHIWDADLSRPQCAWTNYSSRLFLWV